MILQEPDVAITDYFLAIECFVFALLVWRGRTSEISKKNWISVCFLSLGLASLFGGTVHGFFVDESSKGFRIFWPLTLLSIGLTACSAMFVGLSIYEMHRWRKVLNPIIWFLFLGYGITVVFIDQAFRIAIFFYVPAALFLLSASCHIYRRNRDLPALAGLLGITGTLLAPIIQQMKINFPALHLSYNAAFHIVQAAALGMIFWSARWYLGKEHL